MKQYVIVAMIMAAGTSYAQTSALYDCIYRYDVEGTPTNQAAVCRTTTDHSVACEAAACQTTNDSASSSHIHITSKEDGSHVVLPLR